MNRDVLIPLQFDLAIVHAEVDGIEMGVLGDGTPYLTVRGLARASGQAPATIDALIAAWSHEPGSARSRALARLIGAYGYSGDGLIREVSVDGNRTQVFPDTTAMAVLEYFAFESRSRTADIARQSFRLLARQSLRHYIYKRVGYDLDCCLSESWRYLHERMVLNPLPMGYFSVFREISEILIPAIQLGLLLGPHTIPDISVGMRWGKYWTDCELDELYGVRCKHPHHYPASFSKPDVVEAWVYPIASLGEFRLWMRDDYLPKRFPAYLNRKARSGALPMSRVAPLLAAVDVDPAAA